MDGAKKVSRKMHAAHSSIILFLDIPVHFKMVLRIWPANIDTCSFIKAGESDGDVSFSS